MFVTEIITRAGRAFVGKFVRFDRDKMAIWLENVLEISNICHFDEKRGFSILRRYKTDIKKDLKKQKQLSRFIESQKNETEFFSENESDDGMFMTVNDYTQEKGNDEFIYFGQSEKKKLYVYMKFSIFQLKSLFIDKMQINVVSIEEPFINFNSEIDLKNSVHKNILLEVDTNKSEDFKNLNTQMDEKSSLSSIADLLDENNFEMNKKNHTKSDSSFFSDQDKNLGFQNENHKKCSQNENNSFDKNTFNQQYRRNYRSEYNIGYNYTKDRRKLNYYRNNKKENYKKKDSDFDSE